MTMIMLTEQFTNSNELAVIKRTLLDACLDALPDLVGDDLAPWDVRYVWHDELLTETQVSGVISIKDDEYMFVYDFVTSELVKFFENPDNGDEPEESVPYRLWHNDGSPAVKPEALI